MSETRLTDPRPVPGGTRGRVLDVLRATDGPLGVQDVAAALGLHPNTARYHLDALVGLGLATREPGERGQAGRPRMIYRAAGAATGRRSYRLLAEMLTGLVATRLPDAEQAALEAGRTWGRYLGDAPAPWQEADAAEAVRRLVAVLDDAGFEPEVVPPPNGTANGAPRAAAAADTAGYGTAPQAGGGTVIRLRHCPFREVAERHRDVVCALHLGMMQGVLAEARAPVTAERLVPFAEPSVCVTHLAAADGPAPGAAG
ncbi:MAG: helix-turn-helix domain-containing protein [Actinomycetes bacterium]|nr:MAG: ArsR family transcriptional regulator [Actinomycetota bacterium]